MSLQQVLDLPGALIVALDRTGRVTMVNRAAAELLGRPVQEIIGKDWFAEFVPERFRPRAIDVFAELMAREMAPVEYDQTPVLTPSGERSIDWYNALRHDADGGIVGTLSSGLDITERKNAEAALIESEQRFRHLFENNLDAIFWVDPESGILIDCNGAAEELLGRPRGEIIGLHQAQLHPPEDAERVVEIFRELASRGGGSNVDLRVLQATGENIWVSVTVTEMNAGGRSIVQGCFRDISDRMQLDEDRLRSLILHAFDMIFVIDALGHITYQSPAIARIFGYSSEENLGRNIMDFVHADDHEAALASLRLVISEPGRIERAELRALHRDGTWLSLEAAGMSIEEPGEPPRVVINCRDITERKNALAELLDSYEQLKIVENQRRNFLASVAHELRTPLAVTLGGVEGLLSGRTGRVSDDQEKLLELVRRNAERLSRLFDNLLDLARGEVGRLRIDRERIDLRRPVEEAVEGFRPLVGRRELVLHPDLPEMEVSVEADADKIIQIISMRHRLSPAFCCESRAGDVRIDGPA